VLFCVVIRSFHCANTSKICAFCLAKHYFYVFNKPVMRFFRVVLCCNCKNVTNTSLMRLSSTRSVMYLLRAVYVAKTPRCICFTFSTRSEMCLFRIVLRRIFGRNSHVFLRKCMSFTFRTYLIMCVSFVSIVLSCKNITEKFLRNILNVSVFVFNMCCNVALSCCFTSQYLLNTLVSLCKYVQRDVDMCNVISLSES